MASSEITLGVRAVPCVECLKHNKAIEIYDMFRMSREGISFFMHYNMATKELLVCEEDLMRIIQLVNFYQETRPIRLVSREELHGGR